MCDDSELSCLEICRKKFTGLNNYIWYSNTKIMWMIVISLISSRWTVCHAILHLGGEDLGNTWNKYARNVLFYTILCSCANICFGTLVVWQCLKHHMLYLITQHLYVRFACHLHVTVPFNWCALGVHFHLKLHNGITLHINCKCNMIICSCL